jgi:hypothetical protein
VVLFGYLYIEDGYLPYPEKVVKICKWVTYKNISYIWTFIGMVGYYRIWIKGFTIIVIPLYTLMKKEANWI